MNLESFEAKLELFRKACRELGIKATHQRLEIFREVAQSLAHPDAEAVYQGVQQRVPTVSLDTVYRTLKLLTELGFITTLGLRQEAVRFDGNQEPHHHHVCTRCGRIQDVATPLLDLEKVQRNIMAMGTVMSAHIEVRGLCAACAKRAVTTASAQ
jgi:Fur family transcriptional regulator, peroxide stress response regulator